MRWIPLVLLASCASVDEGRVRAAIGRLDHDDVEMREAAHRDLLDGASEAEMRAALAGELSSEQRVRIEEIVWTLEVRRTVSLEASWGELNGVPFLLLSTRSARPRTETWRIDFALDEYGRRIPCHWALEYEGEFVAVGNRLAFPARPAFVKGVLLLHFEGAPSVDLPFEVRGHPVRP